MMAVIFTASATPSTRLPNFGLVDIIVKKSGHVIGYGLLALAFWYALRVEPRQLWLAWFLAILYAATDEFHQSFVFGRHPSWVDVLAFDGGGALIFLLVTNWWRTRKQPIKR
jgi:VanZ family protein